MYYFVTRLYQAEGVTPEITAVSEFMVSLLGADCAGDKDLTFLTLRVGSQPIAYYILTSVHDSFQFHIYPLVCTIPSRLLETWEM